MSKVFRQIYTVPFYDADVQQEVRLSSLVNQLLTVSGYQALELGVSDQMVLEEHGLLWVVTDYAMTIHRLPRFMEQVTIATQALSYNKLYCYREFQVVASNGQVLVTVLASFVLMDVASRKVHKVVEALVAPFGASQDKIIHRGPKYPKELAGQDLAKPVTYFDLDMNGHVNNSRYLDWFLADLGSDFLRQHQLKQVDITYIKEIQEGASLSSRLEQEGLVTHHLLQTADGVKTRARMVWEVRDGD